MSASVPAVRQPRRQQIGYGPQDAADAAGVRRGTLHSWMARGHIHVKSQGNGVERWLTLGQVMLISVLAELDRGGFAINRTSVILRPIERELFKLFEPPRGTFGCIVIADGKARLKRESAITAMSALLSSRGWLSTTVIDLDGLYLDAQDKLSVV